MGNKNLNLYRKNTQFNSDTARIMQTKGVEARKEKKSIREHLRLVSEMFYTDPESGETKTNAEWLAIKVFNKAINGDITAMKFIVDYMGKELVVNDPPKIIIEFVKPKPQED